MPPRGKATTKPKYEQRRLEVLRAAARTFSRLGYQIATLDDVAEELGVTKPAIYYYAKSKDELLFACGKKALSELQEALEKSEEPGSTGLERLTRFFRLYAVIICTDFGRCLIVTEPRDLVTRSRKENMAGRRALNLSVREIIREGVQDGSVRPSDDRALAISMFDAFNGLARWFDPKGPMSLQEVAEEYLLIFTRGIAADTAKPAKPPAPPRARSGARKSDQPHPTR